MNFANPLNRKPAAADTDYVAPSHSHIIGAGRTTPPPPGAGGDHLLPTLLAATALLVTPIALWARFGDDNVVRTVCIVIASIMLSGGLVYFVRRPRYPAFDPRAADIGAPQRGARCGAQVRRTRPLSRPIPRMRARGTASTYRARRSRPVRPSRDVRCHTLGRRTARRRTRP